MAGAEQAAKQQFVNFCFYKVDPLWRRLPKEARDLGKQEFVQVIEGYQGKVIVVPYTTTGIRGDCDFLLWRISYDLETFQEMSSKLLALAGDRSKNRSGWSIWQLMGHMEISHNVASFGEIAQRSNFVLLKLP